MVVHRAHTFITGHPFAAVVNTQTLNANTATAEGSSIQPQVMPADISSTPRETSHSTTSSRMTRTLTRTGWMYSQDRMRVRWMSGRVCRVARVGRAADDRDEGAVLSVCVYGMPPVAYGVRSFR